MSETSICASSAWMRVLFEEQRTWFVTLNDKRDGFRADLRGVDDASRERDAALDRRVTRLEQQR